MHLPRGGRDSWVQHHKQTKDSLGFLRLYMLTSPRPGQNYTRTHTDNERNIEHTRLMGPNTERKLRDRRRGQQKDGLDGKLQKN